jgi:hypothetical protein
MWKGRWKVNGAEEKGRTISEASNNLGGRRRGRFASFFHTAFADNGGTVVPRGQKRHAIQIHFVEPQCSLDTLGEFIKIIMCTCDRDEEISI